MRLFILLVLLPQIRFSICTYPIFNLPKFTVIKNKINKYNFNLFNISNFNDEHIINYIVSL